MPLEQQRALIRCLEERGEDLGRWLGRIGEVEFVGRVGQGRVSTAHPFSNIYLQASEQFHLLFNQ